MKIVDCIIVNDLFELDLLLLKLRVESHAVDEFVVSECEYDYRGRYKGPLWEGAIERDPRFGPFRDRVTVNTVKENLSGISPEQIGAGIDPPQCAEAEWRLRDSPAGYLLKKYADGDRVFTSDVDEVIDFEDPARRDRLFGLLDTDRKLQIERIRFSYDYDCRSFREAGDIVTPCFTVGHIRAGAARLRDKKWVGDLVPVGSNPLAFEYCHVFGGREAVVAKHMSSLHTQWSRRKVLDAVQTATWPMTDYQGDPDRNNRWHWFEVRELTALNSPRFVRENLHALRTYMVPENYRENRVRLYGHDGVHPQNLTDL